MTFTYKRISSGYQVFVDEVVPIGTVTKARKHLWRHEKNTFVYETRDEAAWELWRKVRDEGEGE